MYYKFCIKLKQTDFDKSIAEGKFPFPIIISQIFYNKNWERNIQFFR